MYVAYKDLQQPQQILSEDTESLRNISLQKALEPMRLKFLSLTSERGEELCGA